MQLLIEIPYVGAPCDYLFFRICCRRSELATGGLLNRATSSDPHQALRAEYRWVYHQMGQRLRRKFLPIFEYFELRLLVVALRYLAAGERAAVTAQLRQSLFAGKLCEIIETSEQINSAIEHLEKSFGTAYPAFKNVHKAYLRQGPGGMEQALIGGYLQDAVQRTRNLEVKQFLRYLLDMRNLQALQKHLQWQVPFAPPLLVGGTVEPAVLEKLWGSQDLNPLLELMQKFTRQATRPKPENTEDYLLQGLTIRCQREGREPLQLGVVIDYLWRCQLMARKHGLHFHREGAATESQLAEGGR